MNLLNLLDIYYWFRQPYIAHGFTLWLYVGGFLFLIIAGMACRLAMPRFQAGVNKALLRRAGSLGITMGFLGLIWMFFRQERIPFLAWRFWLLFWVVTFVWWAIKIILRAVKRAPKLKEDEIKRREIDKYLPKTK